MGVLDLAQAKFSHLDFKTALKLYHAYFPLTSPDTTMFTLSCDHCLILRTEIILDVDSGLGWNKVACLILRRIFIFKTLTAPLNAYFFNCYIIEALHTLWLQARSCLKSSFLRSWTLKNWRYTNPEQLWNPAEGCELWFLKLHMQDQPNNPASLKTTKLEIGRNIHSTKSETLAFKRDWDLKPLHTNG